MSGGPTPTCGPLLLSFYEKTDRARREMGGHLLHGPLLHSVPSERKTDRARREMSGGPTPTCGPLLLSSCKKDRARIEMSDQPLHVVLYSFPSTKIDRQG